MKTTLLTLAVLAASFPIFGQGVKITDLDAISSVAGEDLTHVYDMSQASGSRSKKATMNQIRSFLSNDVNFIGGSITNLSVLTFEPSEEDTIESSQTGFGWVDERFTLQTPVGAMQFYATGSPAEATIYWPGKIITGVVEAGELVAEVSGAQVTSGTIPKSVMQASLPQPFFSFNDLPGAAGANGLTYTTTGPSAQIEPSTPGMYFAAIQVTDGGSDYVNALVGKIRTATQVRSDLALGTLAQVTPTGTPNGAKFLRDDNSWQAVSVSPGGSSGQIQYNNGGSFGGVSGLTITSGALAGISMSTGNVTAPLFYGASSGLTYSFTGQTDTGISNSGGTMVMHVGGNQAYAFNRNGYASTAGFQMHRDYGLWWSDGSSNATGTMDTGMIRESANVIQLDVDVNANADDYTIKGPDGITGTNRHGGDVIISGGGSTGSGTSSVVIRTPVASGSGTTAHTPVDQVHISSTGVQIVPPISINGITPIKANGTNLEVPQGIAFGGGTGGSISRAYFGSGAVDFPDTPNDDTSEQTVTVTGAEDGDVVFLGVPAGAWPSGCFFSARVTGTNTVTVRFHNRNGSSQDLSETTISAFVLKP